MDGRAAASRGDQPATHREQEHPIPHAPQGSHAYAPATNVRVGGRKTRQQAQALLRVAVRRARSNPNDPIAVHPSDVARARVLDDELGLAVVKVLHHDFGDIVSAISAVAIAARQDEERGGARHHDVPHVFGLRQRRAAAVLLDFEPERAKVRHLGMEPSSFVLAAPPLGEP
jgi:hypothetical protein